ncbi:MAG: hypothetical protein FWG99_00855 [Treponema sp.]|nr:hypothetical protein [Treponema sp.]
MKKATIFGLILVLLAGIGLVISCEGPAGARGKDALPGELPEITIVDGYWVVNGVPTNVRAEGVSPTITVNDDGNWVINGVPSDIKATGDGGATPTITINDDDFWVINGTVTTVKAAGDDGDSATVTISPDGFWIIDGVTTTVKAGAPTVSISTDGFWVINGVESAIKAAAPTIAISDDGFWVINGVKSTTLAEGVDAIDLALRTEIHTYINQITTDFGDLSSAVIDLYLPTLSGNGINVIWVSSNRNVLGTDGKISLPHFIPANVTLTGFFTKNGVSVTQVYEITVPASAFLTTEQQDMLAFNEECRDFVDGIDNFMDYYHYDIILPLTTGSGSSVAWESNSTIYPILPDRVPTSGRNRVKVTDLTNFIGTINLTATITGDSYNFKKTFPVQVVDRHYTGYLKATFLGSNPDTEQLYFALSRDLTAKYDDPATEGWKILNGGKSVARSISSTGGIRDPFIQRHPNGTFVLSATDMHATSPGSQNRALVLAKSPNLINWTFTEVHMRQRFPANFSGATTAWAPCVIWDRKKGQFMITWSTAGHSGYVPWTTALMFYSYANDDFTDLVDNPVRLQHDWRSVNAAGTSMGGIIDIAIGYFNGEYWANWRTAGQTPSSYNTRLAVSRSSTINAGAGAMDWEEMWRTICNETVAVGTSALGTEGGEWIRKIGTEEMMLFWDRHSGTMLDGLSRETSLMRFGFTTTTDFVTWDKTAPTVPGSENFQHYTMKTDYSANHASIIPLTEEEYQRLLNYTEWDSLAYNNPTVTTDASLKLHYTFDAAHATDPDILGTAANGSDSLINNRADPGVNDGIVVYHNTGGVARDIVDVNGIGTFYTGTSTGTLNAAMTTGNTPAYIDMGATASDILTAQNDFTIATYVRTNSNLFTLVGWSNNMDSRNNLWCFSSTRTASATSGAYIQYRGTAQGYRITTEGNNNVSGITWGETLTTSKWYHIMYRQSGQWGTIYVDGVPVLTSSTRVRTTDLAGLGLIYNYIGRGSFATSNLMPNTYFADFRMYDGAVSEAQVAAMDIPATLAILEGP